MGDPKKHRKKLKKPSHPWQKERILEEIELKKEFGFFSAREAVFKVFSAERTFLDSVMFS